MIASLLGAGPPAEPTEPPHPLYRDLLAGVDTAPVLQLAIGRAWVLVRTATNAGLAFSPRWRNAFLATSLFQLRGTKDRDNDLVKRTRAALAAAGGGRGFRAADGLGDALARLVPAVPAAAGGRRRARPLAGRTGPMPRRRERRFRGGGLRCRGSSRCSCRAVEPWRRGHGHSWTR